MLVGMTARVLAWTGGVVAVMAAAGLGAYLGVVGLGMANEVASVASAFVGLAALGVAVYGVVRAHQDAVTAGSAGPRDGQSVTNSTVGRVTQVKGVTGNVHLGASSSEPQFPSCAPSATPGPTVPRPTPPAVAADGGQAVIDSHVVGDVTQIDGVGGDVGIDR